MHGTQRTMGGRPTTEPARIEGAEPPGLLDIAGKYLSLTSFKRDGSGVATPVWFVRDFDRLLVQTEAASGKAKRIRHNPRIVVAASSASGKIRGAPFEAHAEILPEMERPRTERLMARKYRVERVTVLPIFRLVELLRHGRRAQSHPIIVAITPQPRAATGRRLASRPAAVAA